MYCNEVSSRKDLPDYEYGVGLLRTLLNCNSYGFKDMATLNADVQSLKGSVDMIIYVGHGDNKNGKFGTKTKSQTGYYHVQNLLNAEVHTVVLLCCCAGTVAKNWYTQVSSRNPISNPPPLLKDVSFGGQAGELQWDLSILGVGDCMSPPGEAYSTRVMETLEISPKQWEQDGDPPPKITSHVSLVSMVDMVSA